MTAAEPTHDSAEQRKTLRLAKLFDLRTFIGTLFLIFGAVVTIEGLLASPASIAKASGVNLSHWTGLAMLVTGAFFVAWMLMQPPEVDVDKADLSRPPDADHH